MRILIYTDVHFPNTQVSLEAEAKIFHSLGKFNK